MPLSSASLQAPFEAAGEAFYRTILDLVPTPMFVVDDDLRILNFNTAGGGMLDAEKGATLRRRGGEALHCVHSTATSEGCGRSEYCKDCAIRNSVTAALTGQKLCRQWTEMEVVRNGKTEQIELLVSAAPFVHAAQPLVLLILEDISELMTLRGLLPICARCKKIRDDQNYWQRLEEYFSNHLHVDFTHGLCPDCAKELYPDLFPPPAASQR